MKFCGIDLHSNNSVVVITDETDKVLVSRRCRNELDTVLVLLTPHQAERAGMVVESTYNWYWLVDGLRAAGFEPDFDNIYAHEHRNARDDKDLPRGGERGVYLGD